MQQLSPLPQVRAPSLTTRFGSCVSKCKRRGPRHRYGNVEQVVFSLSEQAGACWLMTRFSLTTRRRKSSGGSNDRLLSKRKGGKADRGSVFRKWNPVPQRTHCCPRIPSIRYSPCLATLFYRHLTFLHTISSQPWSRLYNNSSSQLYV